MHANDKPECFTDHMGLYAMDEMTLRAALAMVQAGMMKEQPVKDPEDEERELYRLAGNVAVIDVSGSLMKKRSKFGGSSYLDTRRAYREALNDTRARAIAFRVESHGGAVRGVQELFDDVLRGSKTKPTVAYCDDVMASAAYYAFAGATAIYGNAAGRVGSLGVIGVLRDYSGAMERAGIKVHVFATSKLKAAGNEDVKHDKDMLASIQREVDATGEMFRAAIATGRGMTPQQVEGVFTGEVWTGAEAANRGLIDAVMTWEDCIAMLNDGKLLVSARAPASDPAKMAKNPLDTTAAVLADLDTSQGEDSMEPNKNTADTANKADDKKPQAAASAPVAAAPAPATDAADFDKRVAEEAKKLHARAALAAAKSNAAESLAEKYGKQINMTADDFKAKFESCASAEAVEAERKITEASLKRIVGGNETAKSTSETRAVGVAAADKHKALIAAKKQLYPHDHAKAVLEARAEDPEGFSAFMRAGNPALS